MECKDIIASWTAVAQTFASLGTLIVTYVFYQKLVKLDEDEAERNRLADIRDIANDEFNNAGNNSEKYLETAEMLRTFFPDDIRTILETYDARFRTGRTPTATLMFILKLYSKYGDVWPSPP